MRTDESPDATKRQLPEIKQNGHAETHEGDKPDGGSPANDNTEDDDIEITASEKEFEIEAAKSR